LTRGAGDADPAPPIASATLLAGAHAIVSALAPGGDGGGPAGRDELRLEGIAWATVELDRAATELAAALGLGSGQAFEPGPDEPWLGAFARRARPPRLPWIVLLEPSTEGRLAAFLARRGEGIAAAYVSGRVPYPVARTLAPGPLGGQRWLAGDRWGPWLILVERRADPRSTAPTPAVPSGE
jgi:hypothetical protein